MKEQKETRTNGQPPAVSGEHERDLDIHAHVHGHEHAGEHLHGHSHVHENTKAVLNRLSRIIGHLGAVRTMVEDGRDCAEVLTQLAAVRSAINGVCKVILKDHLDHCLVKAVQENDKQTLNALNDAIDLLMK